ncbi:MAG: hypothetical protein H0U76_00430 [Ktedonobacteraceae bacterium]|nr:hypothetical protein [Ktedonobacteraceae bacterium]
MPQFGKPKNNTAQKGEVTESAILARFVQLGYQCLIPWGHDRRYDIAIKIISKRVFVGQRTTKYKKSFTIADVVRNASSIILIIEELNKCDVVCVNCHAKRHWKEKHQADSWEEILDS